jgi:uncharacterized protein YjbI with pentapeptide repeats
MERISNWLLSGAAALSLVVTPLAAISPASAGISQNPYYFDGMVTPSLGDGEYRTAFPNWDNYTDSWYFADHDSGRVVNFDANGNFINSFGNAGPEQTPLNYPHDVGVNSQGYTFVSDSESVKAFNAEGVLVAKDVYFGGQKMNSGYISGTHITTDNAGNLYACAYFGSTTIVKLSVAQGRINAEQLIPGSDTCNRYGGANLQVSEDGLVILAAGSPGTIVWANIGGTWKQTFSFLGTEWNSWGNYWLSDEDGTYEVHVLSFDRTTQRKYDPLTGELLGSSTVTNSSALPIARNRSSYFDGITQFALAGPKALWVQSRDGLRRLDLNSNQLTAFGFTNFASASSVSVAANGNINVSDYLGNFLTLNAAGQLLSKVQLEYLPADVSSASYTTDGNIITSYVREDKSAAAALLDPQGRLITDYGTYRGLTSFTITSTGWFPAIHRAYPIACQVLNESNGTYIYYGTRYGNTMVNESCSGRGSAQIQIVENFDSPTESFKTVTLNFPDDSRHYAVGNLALAPNGNILMAAEGEFVWIFDPSGNHIGTIPQPRDTRPNQFGTLDFDNEGTLYVGYGAGVARFKSLKTFTQTPRPSITGKAAVGSTIIADSGTWDQNASLGYQWLRDGDAISGATNSSYLVTSSDFGHSLAVQVTGTGVGYSEVSVTSATKLVVAGSFTLTPVPVVEGVFESGGTLTAVTGLWDANAVLSFQWLRDGVVISGATSRDYRLTGADFGRDISVRVTGSATGYTSVERTSVSSVVALGSQPASSVQVSGKFAVGQVLTANVFAGVSGASASFQWLRDGVVIAGATGATYELTADDLNQDVSVRVVLVADGFRDLTATSSAQSVALGSITGSHSARVSDTPNVGKQVEVVVEGKSVLESVSYRWFREGLPIAGATQVAYTPSRTDYLKYISAQVTFSRAGFNDLVIEIEPQVVELSEESQGLNLAGLDLSSTDLTFYNFKDANLAGANFSTANLSYVNFKGANLTGANLATANFTFADFSGTNLTNADLSNGNAAFTLFVGANLNNANVTGLALDGRDFSQVDLSGVKGQLEAGPSQLPAEWSVVENRMVGPTANLSGANFSRASLKDLNLSGADLTNTNLVGADLTGTNLSGAKLTGVTFHPGTIEATSLVGAATVGSELRIAQTDWAKGIAYSYQWYVNGISLPGATSPTLVVNSKEFGKRLSLTVLAKSRNVTIGSVTSPSVLIGSGTMATKAVRLSGVAKVNSTVQVKVIPWVPGAKVSYQWYLEGKAIKGATSSSLKLLKSHKGRKVFLKVSQSATGYKTGSVSSNTVKVS